MKMQSVKQSVLLALAGIILMAAGSCVVAMPAAPWLSSRVEAVADATGNTAGLRGVTRNVGPRLIGPSVPLQGVVNLLAIPVAFQPDTSTGTSGNGTFPYRSWGPASQPNYLASRLQQLKNYYDEVSGHRVSISYTLAPVVQLEHPMSTYTTDYEQLIEDVVEKGDTRINFYPVDILMLIHAGTGQEMVGKTGSQDIWSVYDSLADPVPTSDGVSISGFCVVPETQCHDKFLVAANTGLDIIKYEANPSAYPNVVFPHAYDVVGVWAHEVGHAFGMPDMYPTTPKTGPTPVGMSLGAWSIMASGAYLPTATSAVNVTELYGSVPSHPDAFCKKLLGWTSVINVTDERVQECLLPQAGSPGIVYHLWTNGDTESREYFLAENRAKMNFDRYVPEAGLMVYRVDDTVGSLTENDLQRSSTHPRVMPMSADNIYEPILDAAKVVTCYEPAIDTAFPSSVNNTHFGPNSTPSSADSMGTPTYVDINNIRVAGNYVYADMKAPGVARINFMSPIENEILFVTRPTVRALLGNVTNIQVTLNSAVLTVPSPEPGTGELSFQLGPLSPGSYQVVISGQDQALGTPISATLRFSVQQKTLPAGLWMIGMPVRGAGSAANVFSGLAQISMAWWDPTNNLMWSSGKTPLYRYYPQVDFQVDAINPPAWTMWAAQQRDAQAPLVPAGMGFWLKLTSSAALSLPCDVLPGTKQYRVRLQKYFNMIASPYSFAVPLSSVLVEYRGQTYSMSEAVNQQLVEPVLYGWNGSEYTQEMLATGMFQPWQGYWFYCRANTSIDPLYLIFQPAASRTVSSALTPMRVRGTAGQWELTVRAMTLNGPYRSAVTVGVLPGATNQVDASIDVLAPPMSPAGVSLSSRMTSGEFLARDYRTAFDGAVYSWEIDVSAAGGTQIALSWPDLVGVPANYRLVLTDTVTGETRYLRTSASYTLMLGSQETHRTLKLVAEPARTVGMLIQSVQAQRLRTGNNVEIRCQVAVPATVHVEVRSLTGRLIRTLTSQSRSTGSVALTWDGTDSGGHAVPRGTYQCQVTVTTAEGQTAKAATLLPR